MVNSDNNTLQTPDIDAIKRISAFEVAQQLGAIHRNTTKRNRDRWAWQGSTHSTYLEFREDGSYYDHKRGIGGSCIDFAMQWMNPSRQKDQKDFLKAARAIASRFNLWRSYEQVRNRALEMVKDHTKADEEAAQFWEAMGIDPHRVTIANMPTNVAWCPAVPWQGSQEHKGADGSNKGWTRQKALSWSHDDEALKYFCVDVDGSEIDVDGRKVIVYPAMADLDKMLDELDRQGCPARVAVSSSWSGIESSKIHLYFVAKQRARNPEQYRQWWGAIKGRIESILKRWRVDGYGTTERIAAWAIDPASKQIHRHMRLVGYSKKKVKKPIAATIYTIHDGANVDFKEIHETTDFKIEAIVNEGEENEARFEYHFGSILQQVYEGPDSRTGDHVRKPFRVADDVWPLSRYRRAEDSEQGVRFLYKNASGQFSYGTVDSGSWVDPQKAKKVASNLARFGVKIRPGTKEHFCTLMGKFFYHNRSDVVTIASTPGWHDGVYVNGPTVTGEGSESWHADEKSEYINHRSGRRGSLQDFKDSIRDLGDTPIIKLAVGTSLAGALIEPLGLDSFIINLCGDSSTGKSTAAFLGASIWGDPRDVFMKWESTKNGFEGGAQTMSGACLILDELHSYQGDLGTTIHMLSSGRGKARANIDGSPRPVRRWSCSVLSTGEVSFRDKLGDDFQGGHNVRAIDIPCTNGATKDALHSNEIMEFAQRYYGMAGDAWINVLATQFQGRHDALNEPYKAWREKLMGIFGEVPGGEFGRILGRFALICTALELAEEFDILPWSSQDIEEMMTHIKGLIMDSWVAADSPHLRSWRALVGMLEDSPALFPVPEEVNRAKKIIGYRDKQNDIDIIDSRGLIFTSETLIKRSGLCTKAGSSPRAFVAWMIETGRAHRDDARRRFGGVQKRWIIVNADHEE